MKHAAVNGGLPCPSSSFLRFGVGKNKATCRAGRMVHEPPMSQRGPLHQTGQQHSEIRNDVDTPRGFLGRAARVIN